jgi:hypothetical protein
MTDTAGLLPAAQAAASRCRDHLKQLRQRYPGILGQLQRATTLHGSSPDLTWPEWCWLPMGAPATLLRDMGLRHPADTARAAALASWRLTQGLYVLTDEHFAQLAPETVTELHDPVTGILAQLPDHCPYLVLGQRGLAGMYVHAEYDTAPGAAPELRLLVDVGDASGHGELDDLLPIAVYAQDGPVISPTNQAIAAIVDGLRAVDEQSTQTAGAISITRGQQPWGHNARELLGRLLVYVACLADPAAEIYAPEDPTRSPHRATPDEHGRWIGASAPRIWRVGFRERPTRRVVR